MRGLSEGVYEEVVALYESGDGFTYFDLKNDLYYQLFYGSDDPLHGASDDQLTEICDEIYDSLLLATLGK